MNENTKRLSEVQMELAECLVYLGSPQKQDTNVVGHSDADNDNKDDNKDEKKEITFSTKSNISSKNAMNRLKNISDQRLGKRRKTKEAISGVFTYEIY